MASIAFAFAFALSALRRKNTARKPGREERGKRRDIHRSGHGWGYTN
jgi:hypothetical protein